MSEMNNEMEMVTEVATDVVETGVAEVVETTANGKTLKTALIAGGVGLITGGALFLGKKVLKPVAIKGAKKVLTKAGFTVTEPPVEEAEVEGSEFTEDVDLGDEKPEG